MLKKLKYKKITVKTVQTIVNKFKGRSKYIDGLLSDKEINRMAFTASRIPIAEGPKDLLVDVGGSIFWLPIYTEIMGYKEIIIICRYGAGQTRLFDLDEIGICKSLNVEIVECDAELSKYPIDNGKASCVVSFELLEHFAGDPMNLIAESNRILKDNGVFCLSTPNVTSAISLAKLALGMHPFGWSMFTDSFADRHNREYTPFEIKKMLKAGGFEINRLQTFTNKKKITFTFIWKSSFSPSSLFKKSTSWNERRNNLCLRKKNWARPAPISRFSVSDKRR